MREALDKFFVFLDRPLYLSARPLLLLLLVPLLLSLSAPLWRISMEAPQYPKGLYMDVYAYKLGGGDDGQHITEINTLNHYIGMAKIDKAALADLDLIPFLLGLLALLTLRVAAVGNVRALIDLVVVALYISGFSMARFVYRLYVFGHNLAPDAPVKVAPFMPVVLGTKQVANFTTHSLPQLGSAYLGMYLTGLMGLCVWHLIAGRRQARRALAG